MSIDFTYRDYITLIFNGILLNLSLVFIFGLDNLRDNEILQFLINNQIIGASIALPVVFLEGHLLLALDKILFEIIPEQIRLKLFLKGGLFRMLFYSIFWCRIYGQKLYYHRTILDKNDDLLKSNKGSSIVDKIQNKMKKKTDKRIKTSSRYYCFSDFFKGVCLTTFSCAILSLTTHKLNYFTFFIILFVLSLKLGSYLDSSALLKPI